jgi:hypothetical protein
VRLEAGVNRFLTGFVAVLSLVVGTWSAQAAEAGKAAGTFTVNATAVTLAHAASKKVEGLFDSTKQDLLVVLTDKPLDSISPDDDIGLSMAARKGEITGLVLRIDGNRLVNVAVFHKGLNGKTVLPGAWFQYAAATPGTGTLSLAARETDGVRYACRVEFAATAAPSAPPAAAATPAAPAKKAESAPSAVKLPPSTTSNIDPKTATSLLVSAFMQKNERQAVELIKLGADPNGRDQYGTPVLNWAVMMCMPQAVQALVDRKADLKYQRAPGMTIMTEAGACPEAAKILKAAGAK